MPDLFIDGEWTAGAKELTREIRCPAEPEVPDHSPVDPALHRFELIDDL